MPEESCELHLLTSLYFCPTNRHRFAACRYFRTPGTSFGNRAANANLTFHVGIAKVEESSSLETFQPDHPIVQIDSGHTFALTSSLHVRYDLSDRQLLLYPVDRAV